MKVMTSTVLQQQQPLFPRGNKHARTDSTEKVRVTTVESL